MLDLKRTKLFSDDVGHVVFVPPSGEPVHGYPSHAPCICYSLVGAVHTYSQDLGAKATIAGIASRKSAIGPARASGIVWDLVPQVFGKLSIIHGTADTDSPYFAIAMLEHADELVPER